MYFYYKGKIYIIKNKDDLSHLIKRFHVGPSVQQEPDHFHMVPTDCNMNRSEPILQRRMDNKQEGVIIY